jgi:hypothetical protein
MLTTPSRRYFSIYTGPRIESQSLTESHVRAIGGEPAMCGTCHVYAWIYAADATDVVIRLQDTAPSHGYRALDVVERGRAGV